MPKFQPTILILHTIGSDPFVWRCNTKGSDPIVFVIFCSFAV